MKLKTKLRKSKNRNNPLSSPYRVTYNRVNESFLTGVKYAEIYPDWDWVHGEPIKTLYALTWNGLNKRVGKWLAAHRFDVAM